MNAYYENIKLQTEEILETSLVASTILKLISDKKRVAIEVWTMNGSKSYILSYHADSRGYVGYLPTIERMINSFEIIPK